MNDVSLNRLMSRQEVAEVLNVSITGIRNLILTGELPSVKIGGRYMIDKDDLKQFIMENKTNNPQKRLQNDY